MAGGLARWVGSGNASAYLGMPRDISALLLALALSQQTFKEKFNASSNLGTHPMFQRMDGTELKTKAAMSRSIGSSYNLRLRRCGGS